MYQESENMFCVEYNTDRKNLCPKAECLFISLPSKTWNKVTFVKIYKNNRDRALYTQKMNLTHGCIAEYIYTLPKLYFHSCTHTHTHIYKII